MLWINLPRPVNGSRWPTAGSEPSNADKQLQNREPGPDSYFSLFALLKWFSECLFPPFLPPKSLQHLAERGHTENHFFAKPRAKILTAF